MSVQAMLAARAHKEGRAQRTAMFRHRAVETNPLCVVAWQLGAEPYSVGAIALGTEASGFRTYVPGYPLDRDLLFAALVPFANEFCREFEAYAQGPSIEVSHRKVKLHVPRQMPQIVIANMATVGLLGRLGRRLAYLSTSGERPADPVLPRLGRHLMWLADHAQVPGQQLMLSVTDLLATHYATAMSGFEMQSLPAIDAWIAPEGGQHAFQAAAAAERLIVGPTPDQSIGEQVHKLMGEFNASREGSKDPAVVRRLIEPLREVYETLINDTWSLIWKVVNRERSLPEAASVARRALQDRIAYIEHLEWMAGPAEGRRKTRMTSRNAALRLNEYELAQARLSAEEAIDDPLRMMPLLLAGKAIAGEVIESYPDNRQVVNGKRMLRPRVTIRTEELCIKRVGAPLWWTRAPNQREWLIEQVMNAGGGSDVTLLLQTNRTQQVGLPRVGDRACFSELNTRDGYEIHLPKQVPWTHHRSEILPPDEPLDSTGKDVQAA
jgi:hypothetical protein